MIWSNLEKALGDQSFSSNYIALQRRNTPNKYNSSKSELASLTVTRSRFIVPQRKRDKLMDELLEARGLDNELEKVTIENIHKHFNGNKLKLESMHLKLNSAKVLGIHLQQNDRYQEIYIGNNQFGDDGFTILTSHLQFNRCIIHLDISKSFITPKGFREALPYLKRIYTLISLNLSGNRLSQIGSQALQELIDEHQNIQFLNIYSTFSEVILGEFVSLNMGFNCIKQTQKFQCSQHLNLEENELKDNGINGLIKQIHHWNILILNLSDCQLTSHGLSKLVDQIVNHHYLESLILSKNNFGGSLSCIYKLLSQNNWLQKLIISYCSISEFIQISEGLKENKALRYLDLSGNKINEKAIYLSLYLQKLNTIKLNDCDLRENISQILMRLYYSNCKILEIAQNKIENLNELKILLQKNKDIEKVNYNLNMINFKQHNEIQKILNNNLKYQHNQIIPKYQKELQNLGRLEQEKIIMQKIKQELNEKKLNKEQELLILKQELQTTRIKEELLTENKEQELKDCQNQLISLNHKFETLYKQTQDFNNNNQEENQLYINIKGEENQCKQLEILIEKIREKLKSFEDKNSKINEELQSKEHKLIKRITKLTQEYEKLKSL